MRTYTDGKTKTSRNKPAKMVLNYAGELVMCGTPFYKREYCQLFIDSMRKGMTIMEFCKKNGFYYDTIRYWKEKYPEFTEAWKKGEEERKLHLVHFIEGAAKGRIPKDNYNTTLLIWLTKVQLGWGTEDLSEVKSGMVKVSEEEMNAFNKGNVKKIEDSKTQDTAEAEIIL